MINDKEFLAAELQMGIGFHNEAFKNLAKATLNAVSDIPFKTVLDYGAGTGVYADAFQQAGFDVSAFELWDAHKEYIKTNAPNVKLVNKPITTDLMLFIEVAEHMTDKELNALFKAIKPSYILFSSTPEITSLDDKWGHINIKTEEKWVEFFSKKGYTLNKKLSYPTSWSLLFNKV